MSHYHLILTDNHGGNGVELEFATLEETTELLTKFINGFYEEDMDFKDVHAKIEILMMMQDQATVLGPTSFVTIRCGEECRMNLSGRN